MRYDPAGSAGFAGLYPLPARGKTRSYNMTYMQSRWTRSGYNPAKPAEPAGGRRRLTARTRGNWQEVEA